MGRDSGGKAQLRKPIKKNKDMKDGIRSAEQDTKGNCKVKIEHNRSKKFFYALCIILLLLLGGAGYFIGSGMKCREVRIL